MCKNCKAIFDKVLIARCVLCSRTAKKHFVAFEEEFYPVCSHCIRKDKDMIKDAIIDMRVFEVNER